MLEKKRLSILNERIEYLEAGDSDSPLVFFLHGLAADPYIYLGLIELLAEHYHVVAPFIYGLDYLQKNPEDLHSSALLTRDFVNSFTEGTYSAVSHSYGGMVALELALLDKKLQKAVLLNPGLGLKNPLSQLKRAVLISLRDVFSSKGESQNLLKNPTVLARYSRAVVKNPFLYTKLAFSIFNSKIDLHSLSQEVLYVYSSKDALFDVDLHKENIEKKIPKLSFYDVGPYSHNWSIYFPELAMKKISEFL